MSSSTAARPDAAEVIARTRALVLPALRAAVATIPDERIQRVAAYQLGWCDADGTTVDDVNAGGKMIRPALAVLSAEVAGGSAADGVPGAVALELVHNFSLLHDDIMDRDTERRHRPTGWVAFGEGQAILGGNAMLTAAVEVLAAETDSAGRTVPVLLRTVQDLIAGQSADLALEGEIDPTIDAVLAMEVGKTAALLRCAASIGAVSLGAPAALTAALADFGHDVGLAFQLVDDVLGVTGDPAITGKSASSDVRAGKRSAVVVAALTAGTPDAAELGRLLATGAPETEADIARARELIVAAGGVRWALDEADRLLARARERLARIGDPDTGAAAQLSAVAGYIVSRDR